MVSARTTTYSVSSAARFKPLAFEMLLPDELKKMMPRALIKAIADMVEPLLGISRLNALHAAVATPGASPEEICRRALDELRSEMWVSLENPCDAYQDSASLVGSFRKNFVRTGFEASNELHTPTIFVCNHPYGGVDALALVVLLASLCESKWKIMANEMLKIFPEFSEALLYVDPFREKDSQSKNLAAMRDCLKFLRGGGTLGMFPAGSVSSFQFTAMAFGDDPWMPSAARIIQLAKATVVPIFFHGQNGKIFQGVSLLSRKARLGFLVHEFVRNAPNRIRLTIGQPLTFQSYSHIQDDATLANFLYENVYRLTAVSEPYVRF